jgi:16S rRNA (cytosine967-C5)-methyltransferase
LDDAWTVTIEALSWVELRRMNEDSALNKAINQLEAEDGDVVDEAKRLVFDVLKRRNTLDYLIDEALAPDELRLLDVGVRSFLRLYTYMIHYGGSSLQQVNDLAEHVRGLLGPKRLGPAEEAIEMIPHERLPWDTFTPTQDLAYRYFHPVWYVEYLKRHFDEQKVVEIIEPAETPKYVRVNTLKADEGVLDDLISLGFRFAKVPGLRYTYQALDSPEGLVDTAPYREGMVIFQDKASVLVGEVASPKPTDLVLDVCAAPGVKTSHLAQLMGNRGRIVSVDYDERRLDSWRRLTEKMGVSNAESVLADATKPGELPTETADIVVLDPPCTGTGTFNESPSGKWRINRNSIRRMADLQSRLLANSAANVAEGGALIYSTCSVTVEENEAVITEFLDRHPSFALEEAAPRIGEPGLERLTKAQRLYPSLHGCQGFFVAKIVKNR